MTSIQKRGLIFGILGTMAWGAGGSCSQFLFEHDAVDPVWLSSLRMCTAGGILICYALLRDRKRLLGLLRSRRDLLILSVFAVMGLLLNQLSYLPAIRHSNAGTATVLQNLSLVLIVLLFHLMRRSLPKAMQLAAVFLAFLGTFLIATQGNIHTLSLSPGGLFFGLSSAVGAAAYSLLSTDLIDRWGNAVVPGCGMAIGAILLAPFRPAFCMPPLSPSGLLALGYIVLFGTVIASALFLQCVHDLGPVNAGLLAGIEPLTATILSALLLGSRFSPADLMGFACIIGAVTLLNIYAGKQTEAGVLSQNPMRCSPFQIIIFGFFLIILVGSLLLMLPVSSKAGVCTSFSDALFTSTSAVCVTGLIVRDTASYWSGFGQTVILLLIQIGGLGVVTVAGAFAILSGRKIGLLQRSTMQEAIAAHQVGGIVRLIRFILKTVFAVELAGAALLFPVFSREFGFLRGAWYALFHSVSAFCNAGFDLMGIKTPFSSLTDYSAHPVVSLVIPLLIILGGIGFLTWEDVRTNRLHIQRYQMQTKVILTVTGALIFFPALYFFFFEFSGVPLGERLLLSFFQSVTPRTAGFNTVDLASLSEAGRVLILLLMMIGGSPGSTAGGMKTTTLAVLLANALAVFRRKENPTFFNRRVSTETVSQAATIMIMYLILFLGGGLIISRAEGLPVLTCLFETASAIGTVGLSMGITPSLGLIPRLILIGLMFFGRVGGLTLIFAALSNPQNTGAKLPQERITVG